MGWYKQIYKKKIYWHWKVSVKNAALDPLMKKVSNNGLISGGTAKGQIKFSKLVSSPYLETTRNFNERAYATHFGTIILYFAKNNS